MSKPIVAIVGRPNVGKSKFFNYVVGERISIVEDTPGVTRDRIYADCTWRDRTFTIIDTAGIEVKSNDMFLEQMKEQVDIAIGVADVIIFMVDIKSGIVSDDKDIALMLKKSKKPVILACNKADNYGETSLDIYEFYSLGLGNPFPVSAANAIGIGDLLDAIYYKLPPKTEDEVNDDRIKVAIIGKPNVGKSSLLNKIIGQKRSIVSNVAGTTRDAVDSDFDNKYGKYTFIDTAGIRKKSKVSEKVEKYSVMRTIFAIERSDVCLVLIDANDGVTDQDAKILGEAHEAGKGIIIVVNKWDMIKKENGTTEKFRKAVYNDLSYASYAPVVFIYAETGQRVNNLFEMINKVNAENCKRVSTAVINEVINEAIAVVQPPTDKGRRLKITYGTQASTKPPTFIIFCNDKKLFHFSYQRYLINCIRENFGFEGTPVRLIIREKGDEKV